MTTLEKIVKKAQALKKSYPKKFTKWTDYVKEASKEFRSKITTAKKKSKISEIDLFEDYANIPKKVQKILDKHTEAFEYGDYRRLEKALVELEKIGYTFDYELDGVAYALRPIAKKGKIGALPVGFQATLLGNPFYIVNQFDIYGNVVLEIVDKKTNEVFFKIDNTSSSDQVAKGFIDWLDQKKSLSDSGKKDLSKIIKPLAINLIQEVKSYNKGKKTIKPVKEKKSTKKQITPKQESDLIRKEIKDHNFIMPHGYGVKKSKLRVDKKTNKLIGNVLKKEERFLSFNDKTFKPSSLKVYNDIEKIKSDILRLINMKKDFVFSKHKSSINGAIVSKNKDLKNLLKKLK